MISSELMFVHWNSLKNFIKNACEKWAVLPVIFITRTISIQMKIRLNPEFASFPEAMPSCISIFISDIFLSVSLLSFAKLFNTMSIWIPLRPDIRELQTSRLCRHDAIPNFWYHYPFCLQFEGLWCSIHWAPLHGLLSSHSIRFLRYRYGPRLASVHWTFSTPLPGLCPVPRSSSFDPSNY